MTKQILRNRKGQTTVEYILIISVIVVVISVFGTVAKTQMKATVEQVFQGIQAKIGKLMKASLDD